MNAEQRLDQLESFLAHDPGNATLLSEAVQQAIQAGLPERGRRLLDASQAESTLRRHLDASILIADGHFEAAAAVLAVLLDEGREDAGILFNLGYAQFGAGTPEAAVQTFSALVSRDDAPEHTLVWLLRALHHAGLPADAIAAWNAAPTRLRGAEAAGIAALACLDVDDFEGARRLSAGALAAGSTSTEALVAAATLAIADDDLDAAMTHLDSAGAEPKDGRLLATRAIAWMARGDLAQAEQTFNHAVATGTRHLGTWHALAWCQIAGGRVDAARRTLETALGMDRNFAETHGALAVVAALQGRSEAAHEAIARAQRLDRESLSWRYAEVLLSGQAHDPAVVRGLARQMLGRQRNGDAVSLARRLE